ncbi:carbamoyl-phosphate synthase (glutamine-hydrolyzing) cpa2 [Cerrena zonata]|uniref:Ammonium-dependent carbamoyl phosphate synthetase n=1 Tax=Cerrena zonata TaxID=2478898 RepID=A0AAW0FPI1_9APHY
MGVFERYGVKVLGTPIKTLETSEDRDLFAQALKEIDIPIAESIAVETVDDALKAAENVGYPIIVRSAYSLGGLGSGFAANENELRNLAAQSLSLAPQILVEKSLKGWKEVEYEVVRDRVGNCITVCNMENFDPLGIHTGDSIVVAPSQTLSDEEYHMLRSAAIKIIRHLGVVGECNVQYALQPDGLDYRVIEVNARLSRSSALASKATGYPLAYTAAKIALGHTLPELPNPVTKTTSANFEPSLDYMVTKIPRWDLSKFQHVKRDIGSAMKSVGEVMAIGRNFEESFQKAIRQIDPSYIGLQGDKFDNLDESLANPTDRRWLAVGQALLHENYTVDQVHDLTKIDKWFLYKIMNIVNMYKELESVGDLSKINSDLMMRAKKLGFSDKQIALSVQSAELEVRSVRKSLGITPFVKKIDTLAAEFPANTNYLYTTYNATSSDLEFNENGTMVLGSGVYRIGSSVEFDWCGVSAARALRESGHKTIMINYNPETVSTDFDEVDRLYFEELSLERVLDIYELENAQGVVVSVGGQLPQNIALSLQNEGCNVLGTNPEDIDKAEDRHKFSQILDSIGVDQPEWKELTSIEEAESFANKVGYPVLVRPSYVLSGAAMSVINNQSELDAKLSNASKVSQDHPVVISKFIQGAQEIDIDGVANEGEVLVHAVSEHVENAGVHSGDATLVLPPQNLSPIIMNRLKVIADKVASAWNITGPFNMQIIKNDQDGKLNDEECQLKVIECNIRASRSFPFVSKVLGTNFIEVAVKSLIKENVPAAVNLMDKKYNHVATKVPQFSFTRLAGADPFLGVEMSSTGEIACFGNDLVEAYWTSIQSTMNFHVPHPGSGILFGGDLTNDKLGNVAKTISGLGYKFYTASEPVAKYLNDYISEDVEVIEFPKTDKRALREIFQAKKVGGVFNLAKARAEDLLDEDYVMRRNAIDFAIPLFNEPNTSLLFAQCLKDKVANKPSFDTLPAEVSVPAEVQRWSEFIGGKPV